jgi:hypothetical protein
MKKILLYTISLLFLVTSCDLDYFPSDALTPDQLSADPGGAIYITEGNYSMFKDEYEYKGLYSSGNTYIRHYMMMTEYPGDNVTLSGNGCLDIGYRRRNPDHKLSSRENRYLLYVQIQASQETLLHSLFHR